ncbi:MAG: NFACT family protein [bacterium]|jgi:predicted ribosome quality control (RQC) complex YloA/Tae2 family protein
MPLILGSFTATFLARELDGLLKGGVIKGVYISDDRVVSISYRVGRMQLNALRFLHAPGFALLCAEAQTELESELTHLPRFEGAIKDASIVTVRQVDLDRVIKVELETGEGGAFNLYFELNPSMPNLFLTDGDDRIEAMLLKAGTRTRSRRLDVGRQYVTPPASCKIDPAEVTEKYMATLNWWQDDGVLSQSVTGVGPFLSREVAHRARRHNSQFAAFEDLMRAYNDRRCDPHTFVTGKRTRGRTPTIGIAWFSPEQDSVAESQSFRSLNEAAIDILNNLSASRAFDTRKARTAKAVKREIRKWERVEEEARRHQEDAGRALDYRKRGELIMANLDNIRKGQAEVALPDLHEGGRGKTVIELHPNLTPHANAEVYFKKARTADRRARLAHDKLEVATGRLGELARILDEVETIEDPRRLTEIEEKVLFIKSPGRKEKPPEDERAVRLGIRPRRYEIAGGWTVLVGRSARENDILTHRYASPSDLWFHARQAQGAHVVLRREKGKGLPPMNIMLKAAAIAAYYSKARTSTHVPVSYTEKRYVKKVRKGPPGTAAMLREKVVFVDPWLPGA